ncbi:MAG: chemotaxis protein CheD [Deltaproteobacteria bacterium]|nr:chemotaxis protein CheD [Deltaproteobacteria bacterium]
MTTSLVVDISDLRVSSDPGAEIVTYALGSCIGVTAWDPKRQVGGLLHYLLPLSSASPEKGRERPAMFADLGIPLLFERMYALGCVKRDLVVTVSGGACINGDQNVFNIGKRNYTVLRKMFWKNDVLIAAEDVGGGLSRTVRLDLSTGTVKLRIQGEEKILWAKAGQAQERTA